MTQYRGEVACMVAPVRNRAGGWTDGVEAQLAIWLAFRVCSATGLIEVSIWPLRRLAGVKRSSQFDGSQKKLCR